MSINNNEAGENLKASMDEVYKDLRSFKETRKSVEELIKYRSLMNGDGNMPGEGDADKMNEYKGKAFDAINNLFNED